MSSWPLLIFDKLNFECSTLILSKIHQVVDELLSERQRDQNQIKYNPSILLYFVSLFAKEKKIIRKKRLINVIPKVERTGEKTRKLGKSDYNFFFH